MLKKIFKKDGIILFIQNEQEDIHFGYYIINNFIKDKNIEDYKKGYYKTKSFTY